MTRDEQSILMYLETCCVDYGGKVDMRKVNPTDMEIIKKWQAEGWLDFGRIRFSDHIANRTHWVTLSGDLWEMACRLRRERADRLYQGRTWEKTDEQD